MSLRPAFVSGLTADARMMFLTRMGRLFAYGFLGVVLVLYLDELGLSRERIGLLLTLTLLGDTAISLWLTTHADRTGRRLMLMAGAGLMIFAGVLFVATDNFVLLLIAATIGVLSPSGGEVGPFLSIEQAVMSQEVSAGARTEVFAWYNLVGSFSTALGALAGGCLCQALTKAGLSELAAHRSIVAGYSAMGLVLFLLFSRLSPAAEVRTGTRPPPGQTHPGKAAYWGLHGSGPVVARLSALFFLDAFGGGFVLQSIMAYWFHLKFGVNTAVLGGLFFGANLLAGISALSASWVASRIGLINTMVLTHLPSNVLLILVPMMPNLPLAMLVLLLRFSISQMDVPTRQSYTMAVVAPEERSAAAGITGISRTLGASAAPLFAGPLLANPALTGAPFVISGVLKVVYDLLLYRSFKAVKPPDERAERT